MTLDKLMAAILFAVLFAGFAYILVGPPISTQVGSSKDSLLGRGCAPVEKPILFSGSFTWEAEEIVDNAIDSTPVLWNESGLIFIVSGIGDRFSGTEGEAMTAATREEIRVDPDSHGITVLPDGSAFSVISFPLPKDHWIYGDGEYHFPPMPMRMGIGDPRRKEMADMLVAAGRHAVKAATMDGKEMDFDPDALIQNLVVGMLGYHTENGFSSDDFDNPTPREEIGDA